MDGGGYDAEFVEDVADYLKCIICQLALRDPLLLVECGHRLCSSCFGGLQEHAFQRNVDVFCPYDRIMVHRNKVVMDKGIARVVLDLQVKCECHDDGCEWVGELRNLQIHLENSCAFVERKPPETPHLEEKETTANLFERNTDDDEDYTSWSPGAVSFISCALIAIAVALYYYSTTPPHHNYRSVPEFNKNLDNMEKDFPKQNEILWSVLRNSGQRHLNRVHVGDHYGFTPLSYLIAGYAGSGETIDCFVTRLAHAFTYGAEQTINSQKFSGENNKKKLDNKIESLLNGSTKFLSVKDIHKLPFIVAQSFMSFAGGDNTAASSPQSVLVLTTVLPFSHNPAQLHYEDEMKVGEYFRSKIWADVHKDFTSLLWSRIGNGLILIKKEEKNICI